MSAHASRALQRLMVATAVIGAAAAVGFVVSYYAAAHRWSGAYGPMTHIRILSDVGSAENHPLEVFAAVSLTLLAFGALATLTYRGSSKAVPDLHGSARWTTWREIRKDGLLGSGLHLGGFRHRGRVHHLRDDSNTHLLTFAPTRSGKGVSIIIPTLLTNHEKSFFVLDIKGENHALSSGWRESAGNRIIRLAFADHESHRYNPLDEIEWGSDTAIKEVQNLAGILTSTGKLSHDSHWADKAREALTGLLIHTLEDRTREQSLHAVGNLLVDPDKDLEETLNGLVEGCRHPEGKQLVTALRNTPTREQGSIISSLRKSFELFADPIVRRNTSDSDFRIADLVDGEEPTSLYFVIEPNDLDRLAPLARVFLTQLISRLAHGMAFRAGQGVSRHKHPLVLLLDEFASLQSMPVVEHAIAFMAGYGIRAHIIVQDLDQITKHYGRENGIIGNCATRIAFAPNNTNTAEHLSKSLGNRTVVRTRTSTSGKEWSLSSSRSGSIEETGRPLMTGDEIRRLAPMARAGPDPGGEILILREGKYPIKGTRTPFFRNPAFLERSRMAPARIAPRPALPEPEAEEADPE